MLIVRRCLVNRRSSSSSCSGQGKRNSEVANAAISTTTTGGPATLSESVDWTYTNSVVASSNIHSLLCAECSAVWMDCGALWPCLGTRVLCGQQRGRLVGWWMLTTRERPPLVITFSCLACRGPAVFAEQGLELFNYARVNYLLEQPTAEPRQLRNRLRREPLKKANKSFAGVCRGEIISIELKSKIAGVYWMDEEMRG